MSSSDPFVGTMLGSYEVMEAVGEGGMARIYKGYHAELARYSAIKVVNWGLQEDPEFSERFRREAQAIASLRHPNIVQIFDFGKYENGYFMVMEFIGGGDLSQLLHHHKDENTLLTKERVIDIIKDVGAALDHAHGKGVIHRDVKPSNIMINQGGQSILTDFGLVMLSSSKSQATLGSTFGTPHYIAPEQAISSAAAVTASDIYSLGVILYEMATNQLLFDDESPLSVALKHISDVPTPPTTLNPDLPRAVEDVILTSLAKQPEDRFTTAKEMAEALEVAWQDTVLSRNTGSKPMAPVLPVGVPAPAEVKNKTLPNAPVVRPVLPPANKPDEEPASRYNKWLNGWVLVPLFVGIVLLIGAFAYLQGDDSEGVAAMAFTNTPVALVALTLTSTPSATPKPTPTHSPTSPPSTETPTPTSTPSPTVVPSDTPSPTLTPSPTATATPTVEPTATPPPTETLVPLPSLTPTLPTDMVLTLDQLRGKILFKTDRSGAVEIYRMDANGANQVPLARENWSLYSELEADLSFSPNDEEQIVIRGEGQFDLWRTSLIGGQELRVTSTQAPEYDAAWSPIDNHIVYVSEETGNGDIYMLNLDGSAVVRLTDNVEDFDKHPTWSPDGTRVAYWSDQGFKDTRQIWVIDLQSNVITSLSDNPFNDWDPVWVH